MNIRMTITGTKPLLMHDSRLADPDDPIVKEIKKITDKRKKTEEDRREIEKFEFLGGLVLGMNGDGPSLKTSAIRKCLINAGRISKQGKLIERGVAFKDLTIPLEYEGPRNPEALWKLTAFHNRASVRIGAARTMRMRPQFLQWGAVVEGFLLGDVIDIDTFKLLAERAGLAEGLGDNRVNGYGRFEVKVTEI